MTQSGLLISLVNRFAVLSATKEIIDCRGHSAKCRNFERNSFHPHKTVDADAGDATNYGNAGTCLLSHSQQQAKMDTLVCSLDREKACLTRKSVDLTDGFVNRATTAPKNR